MKGANSMQVGGSHYSSSYQHWDFVTDYGIHYLLGCATKYLTRYRKKNGIQDLEKCVHYFTKARERKSDIYCQAELGFRSSRNLQNPPLDSFNLNPRRAFCEDFLVDLRRFGHETFPEWQKPESMDGVAYFVLNESLLLYSNPILTLGDFAGAMDSSILQVQHLIDLLQSQESENLDSAAEPNSSYVNQG